MKRSIERRKFLKYLGAATLGPLYNNLFSLKKNTQEKLYSYVSPPDGEVLGLPTWYSSVCRQCSAGCGIQVKTREGRAKKIEGNPFFPVNNGRLCLRGHAGLQVLYNPDRIKTPLIKSGKGYKKISWEEAESIVAEKLSNRDKSKKVAFITEPLRSSQGKLLTSFANHFGADNVYPFELFGNETAAQANEVCFGFKDIGHYDIANSAYVLSLGTDLLDTWASPVKHADAYGKLREPQFGSGKRGTLVQFETKLSLTGANADEWFPIKPGTEGLVALSIAQIIVAKNLFHPLIKPKKAAWAKYLEDFTPEKISKLSGVKKEVLEQVARKFAQEQPSIAISAGLASNSKNGFENATAANVLNHLVGSVGKSGGLINPSKSIFNDLVQPNASFKRINELANQMSKSEVGIAFIYNSNPVFNLPDGIALKEGLEKVPFVVSFSAFKDDTTANADLILPSATYLESWDSYIPLIDNGNKSIGLMQPVISPLYNSKQLGEIILSIAKQIKEISNTYNWHDFRTYVKQSWRAVYNDAKARGKTKELTFGNFWTKCQKQGGFWEEESTVAIKKSPDPAKLPKPQVKEEHNDKLSLIAYPSHNHYDGRGANQPWLQQLPEPLITGAWGTWAAINPEKAKELGVEEGDLIEIKSQTGKIEVPAYPFPAIHPEAIAIPIGQGHQEYGRYAKKRGVNPLKIVKSETTNVSESLAWSLTEVEVKKGNGSRIIAKTDPDLKTPGLENGVRELDREIVQWISPEELETVAHKKLKAIEAVPPLDRAKKPTTKPIPIIGLKARIPKFRYRWGMVVDLDKCTGCQACMTSCYAENNIPIVDEEQTILHRHKNWMRIDRYWEGEYPNIRAKMIPVNCYQCGKAPCEAMCLAYAPFRTDDGLNGQTYHRCVGTRYCNTNCPFRSRIFNWLNPEWPSPLDQQLNPEVSVRSSGFTDKCTFCAHRIREAKEAAHAKGRRVKDGEVQPACAQTCPSGAIVFGDLLDKKSKVSQLTRDPRRYQVLEELDIEPGVIFLKAVRKGAEEEKKGNGH
ncbi:MAG: hypothetical protein C4562_00390 [Actinobacteria bacterium]|nr:MAG: hypothetical protein C4562_00390 [Actinomycetota bacterium]